MQFLVEEACSTALELHEGAAVAQENELAERETALAKSKGRLDKILERMGG